MTKPWMNIPLQEALAKIDYERKNNPISIEDRDACIADISAAYMKHKMSRKENPVVRKTFVKGVSEQLREDRQRRRCRHVTNAAVYRREKAAADLEKEVKRQHKIDNGKSMWREVGELNAIAEDEEHREHERWLQEQSLIVFDERRDESASHTESLEKESSC